MCVSSTCCFGSMLLILCCARLVRGNYYTQLYDSQSQGTHRASPGIRLTTPVPGSPPGRSHADPSESGTVARDQYYSRLFDRLRGLGRTKEKFAPSVSPSSPSSLSPSFSAISVPPEIAAMIPPGGTIDDIPKSQLAVLTGDPDYTRFRQLFLRQMCQRLLEGPRAPAFQFCLNILAL